MCIGLLKINKILAEVGGLVGSSTNKMPLTSSGKLGLTLARIKWALWREEEATEILQELQQHKLSLNLMLSIIQW